MNWDPSTGWWVVCGLLLVAEMLTGTFYLLMLALGATSAALGAQAGLGFASQLALVAVVGGGAVIGLEVRRRGKSTTSPAAANRDMNLDIGGQVRVETWTADGTARVSYRGAQWAAQWVGDAAPAPGLATIRGIEGSRLLLGP